jgi:predicted nucleotide-binding protein
LQAADYNTYERPLKKLVQALDAVELREINETLKSNVDFDKFIAESNRGGSMLGSASLNWPSEREKELGLALILLERGANDPTWFLNFAHDWYYAGSKLIAGIRKLTSSVIIPFGRDYKAYVEMRYSKPQAERAEPSDLNRIFVVHGHDDAVREMVARFVTTLGFEPIILHEQANRGMTIPEKLIAHSNVGFAIILLTPDDLGNGKHETQLQPRARQNVILELGYFVGKLGRERVCALKKGDIEIPSDYLGVVYTDFDNAGGWKLKLGQELQAVGYDVNWNEIMAKG